jgi:hypothetical protein
MPNSRPRRSEAHQCTLRMHQDLPPLLFLCSQLKRHAPPTQGDFKAELYMDTLPVTSSNFADLAKTGFYDGLSFHRVINGCVLSSPPHA